MKKIILTIGLLFSTVANAQYIGFPTSEDLDCLAMNMYHEARGESVEGHKVVARVTLNRVLDNRFPDSICDVVWQYKERKGHKIAQFSWTQDGKSDTPKDNNTYSEMIDLANIMIFKYMYNEADTMDNALYYHADYVSPNWDWSKLVKIAQVDTHIVYADK